MMLELFESDAMSVGAPAWELLTVERWPEADAATLRLPLESPMITLFISFTTRCSLSSLRHLM